MNYLSIILKAEEPRHEHCPSLVRMVGEKNNLDSLATLYI